MFRLIRNGRKLKGGFLTYEEARRVARSRIRKDHADEVRGMSNPPITPFGYNVVRIK
jgi:hypothetical protein